MPQFPLTASGTHYPDFGDMAANFLTFLPPRQNNSWFARQDDDGRENVI